MRSPGCSRGSRFGEALAGRPLPAGRRAPSARVNPRDCGDVAQLGENLVRNEGVGGSNPLISTKLNWARPSATRTCEPRQDRKVAAVSNSSGVPLTTLALSLGLMALHRPNLEHTPRPPVAGACLHSA